MTWLDPQFPDGQFALVDDDGVDEGPFTKAMFVKDPDEGYWIALTDGRPIFMRVKAQDGQHLTLADGGGDEYSKTICPVVNGHLIRPESMLVR